MIAAPPGELVTTGVISRRYGVPSWAVRRVLDSGNVAVVRRCGPYRAVTSDQIPAILEALGKLGYPARTANS